MSKTRILEGQILGGSLHDLGLRRFLACLALQAAQHRRLGLGEHERLDAVVVMRQVGAGAGADLEDGAAGLGEQAVAHVTHSRLLARARHRVVDRGEDGLSEAHAKTLRHLPTAIVNSMVQYSGSVDRAFAALADPTRRAVLERLGAGSATISELADPFGMSLTGMKKHIRLLEEAELVTTEKVGRVRRCRLAPYAFEGISTWLQRLDRFAQVVERTKGT